MPVVIGSFLGTNKSPQDDEVARHFVLGMAKAVKKRSRVHDVFQRWKKVPGGSWGKLLAVSYLRGGNSDIF